MGQRIFLQLVQRILDRLGQPVGFCIAGHLIRQLIAVRYRHATHQGSGQSISRAADIAQLFQSRHFHQRISSIMALSWHSRAVNQFNPMKNIHALQISA